MAGTTETPLNRHQPPLMTTGRSYVGFENTLTEGSFGITTIALSNGVVDLHFDSSGLCTNIHEVIPNGIHQGSDLVRDNPDSNTCHPGAYVIQLKSVHVDMMIASNKEYALPNGEFLRIDVSGIPSIRRIIPNVTEHEQHMLTLQSKKSRALNNASSGKQRLPYNIMVRIFRALLEDFGDEKDRLGEISAICLGLTNKENWRILNTLVKTGSMDDPIWFRMSRGFFENRTLANLLMTWMGPKYRQVNQAARFEAKRRTSHRYGERQIDTMPTLYLSREIYGDGITTIEGKHNQDEIRLLERYVDYRAIIQDRKGPHTYGPRETLYIYLQLPNPFGMGDLWYPAAAKAMLDNFRWREWDGLWYDPHLSSRMTPRPNYKRYISWYSFRLSSLYQWVRSYPGRGEENYNSTTLYVRQKLRDIDCTFIKMNCYVRPY